MKKIAGVFCLVAIIAANMTSFAFAEDFKIEKTSIKDGAQGVQLNNLALKVYFNKDVHNRENMKENNKFCKLVDKKGNVLPTRVISSNKEKNVALLIYDTTQLINIKDKKALAKKQLKPVSEYEFIVMKGFKASDGSLLSEGIKIGFKTINPSTTAKISFAMMALVIVVMIVASRKAMKKRKEEASGNNRTSKVNPYKEAKKTGKSVSEIVEKDKKRKAKNKEALDYIEEKEQPEVESDETVYHVGKRASFYVAGGKYKADEFNRRKKIAANKKKTSGKSRKSSSKKKGKK